MRTRTLLAALLTALATAVPAWAAPPADLSADPLARGALLALPSVYRVDVVIRGRALRLANGTLIALVPQARTMTERGTAVAVADGGWLVTAGHVAAPDGPTLARMAYQTNLAFQGSAAHADDEAAQKWVAETGARLVGPGVVSRSVRPADAGGTPVPTAPLRTLAVYPSATADLALIRIDAPDAPALGLEEGESRGTPVATIGFGAGSALNGPVLGDLEPAVRTGAISLRVTLEPDTARERAGIAISVPVERGDSGAPVVDTAGKVRGIVIVRTPRGGGAEESTEVRQLLESRGLTPGPNTAAKLFRPAMEAFWRLDFPEAEKGFDATLGAFGGHALAARERSRAVALAGGDYRLTGERRRGLLLGVGALAAIVALACALALALGSMARRRGGTAGR